MELLVLVAHISGLPVVVEEELSRIHLVMVVLVVLVVAELLQEMVLETLE